MKQFQRNKILINIALNLAKLDAKENRFFVEERKFFGELLHDIHTKRQPRYSKTLQVYHKKLKERKLPKPTEYEFWLMDEVYTKSLELLVKEKCPEYQTVKLPKK